LQSVYFAASAASQTFQCDIVAIILPQGEVEMFPVFWPNESKVQFVNFRILRNEPMVISSLGGRRL
jgi:hypothetical protein